MSRTAALLVAAVLSAVALVTLTANGPRPARVAYPEGYRSWTHVKSMAIVDDTHPLFGAFGGIHHVYVNAAGLAALRAGKPFPDGAVFVFDLLSADSAAGAYTEGARKFIGVMQRNRRAFAATGGWGFEGFAADTRDQRMVNDAAGQCFGCHQSQEPQDFVFTTWRK